MFPDFLYQLNARDLSGSLVEIVARSALETTSLTAVTSVLYTVPADKIFVLNSATTFISNGGLSGIAFAGFVTVSGPSFGATPCDIGMVNPTLASVRQYNWSFSGEVLIPESSTLEITTLFSTAGTNAVVRHSLWGYALPKGNIHG